MSPPDITWTHISTERDFQRSVTDRTWISDGIEFIIHPDGRLTGQVDGEPLTGTWYWSDRFFCRTAELAGEDVSLDCEIIEIRANQMRYTRDKGKGEASIVTVKKTL